MDKIKEFIKAICLDLFIPEPSIVYVDRFEQSKTMRMAVDYDSRYIMIRKDVKIDLDSYFDLAHELRHIYQMETGDFSKDDYILRENTDLATYNQQPLEVDAHAYAAIMMIKLFHVKPLWQGFDPDTIMLIEERIKELLDD